MPGAQLVGGPWGCVLGEDRLLRPGGDGLPPLVGQKQVRRASVPVLHTAPTLSSCRPLQLNPVVSSALLLDLDRNRALVNGTSVMSSVPCLVALSGAPGSA